MCYANIGIALFKSLIYILSVCITQGTLKMTNTYGLCQLSLRLRNKENQVQLKLRLHVHLVQLMMARSIMMEYLTRILQLDQ